MGARGPAPLPANVHLLKGNPSKKPIGELLGELRPPVALPTCPDWLSTEARAEWDRIGAELQKLGLVAEIDRAVLAMYCVEYARWQWAEQKMAEANAADARGEAGMVERTPQGYRMQSVYLQIARKAQEAVGRYAAQFGMAPSARSRVRPSDNQGDLFGGETGAADGWGAM